MLIKMTVQREMHKGCENFIIEREEGEGAHNTDGDVPYSRRCCMHWTQFLWFQDWLENGRTYNKRILIIAHDY